MKQFLLTISTGVLLGYEVDGAVLEVPFSPDLEHTKV